MPGIKIETLPSAFMASCGEIVGVGETREMALKRLFEKMPLKKKMDATLSKKTLKKRSAATLEALRPSKGYPQKVPA